MSAIEMASVSVLRYQKLKTELGCDDGGDRAAQRPKNWFRFRRIPIRRRFRLKVPSLRRFWRKARLLSAMRISCAKVIRRLKECQVHFGDLFAGNYLFMQINPASLKDLEKQLNISKIA